MAKMSMVDQRLLQMHLEAAQTVRTLLVEKAFTVTHPINTRGTAVVCAFDLFRWLIYLPLDCRGKKIMALMCSTTTWSMARSPPRSWQTSSEKGKMSDTHQLLLLMKYTQDSSSLTCCNVSGSSIHVPPVLWFFLEWKTKSFFFQVGSCSCYVLDNTQKLHRDQH